MGLTMLSLLVVAGCKRSPETDDQRLVELIRESMARQAEQNRQLAQQSEQIIEVSQKLSQTAQELVAHDAQARQELIAVQDRLNMQLHQQRAAIDAGRDQLEQDRRELAQQRHRDPIVAEAIAGAALLLACVLPLAVCALVVWRLDGHKPEDAVVAELLVTELVSDRPRLLPDWKSLALPQQAPAVTGTGNDHTSDSAGNLLPS